MRLSTPSPSIPITPATPCRLPSRSSFGRPETTGSEAFPPAPATLPFSASPPSVGSTKVAIQGNVQVQDIGINDPGTLQNYTTNVNYEFDAIRRSEPDHARRRRYDHQQRRHITRRHAERRPHDLPHAYFELLGSATITNLQASSMNMRGPITGLAASRQTLTFAVPTNSLNFGAISGNLDVIKSGTAALTMGDVASGSLPSTYLGDTFIRGGNIIAKINNVLPTTTNLVMGDPALATGAADFRMDVPRRRSPGSTPSPARWYDPPPRIRLCLPHAHVRLEKKTASNFNGILGTAATGNFNFVKDGPGGFTTLPRSSNHPFIGSTSVLGGTYEIEGTASVGINTTSSVTIMAAACSTTTPPQPASTPPAALTWSPARSAASARSPTRSASAPTRSSAPAAISITRPAPTPTPPSRRPTQPVLLSPPTAPTRTTSPPRAATKSPRPWRRSTSPARRRSRSTAACRSTRRTSRLRRSAPPTTSSAPPTSPTAACCSPTGAGRSRLPPVVRELLQAVKTIPNTGTSTARRPAPAARRRPALGRHGRQLQHRLHRRRRRHDHCRDRPRHRRLRRRHRRHRRLHRQRHRHRRPPSVAGRTRQRHARRRHPRRRHVRRRRRRERDRVRPLVTGDAVRQPSPRPAPARSRSPAPTPTPAARPSRPARSK